MADPHVARRLASIHRTLELIAFLLAVLLAQASAVGLVVGGGAAVLLSVNALSRYLDADSEESVTR